MNKRKVNDLLPRAYQVLKDTGIANANGVIIKTYRGYISSFGAALETGSLLAAIAYFDENKESAKEDRSKLMQAIKMLLYPQDHHSLFDIVKNGIAGGQTEFSVKEDIVNAAIALKLAMNLYNLREE